MTNFPEVHPLNASPEIAAIYADIRAVSGLSMVNLIWRHFAAFPDILQWAWTGVRPLVASQELVASRQRLVNAIELPTLPSVTPLAWQTAGVSTAELTVFRAMVADYVRGNSTNVIVLTALRLRLEGASQATPAFKTAAVPASVTPSAPLPRIDALDPGLAEALKMLPALGSAPANVAEMRPALERFTRLIIPDLTPVCVAVQRLLPNY
jgi:hypothetical protein